MQKQAGFTLIELMLVVAIIAVLSIVAMPFYRDYVAKAQVTAALAEIRPGKTTLEAVAQDGRDASLVDSNYVGLTSSSRCSAVSARLAADGVGEISCTLAGSAAVTDLNLKLKRSSAGVWSCDATELDAKYRPSGCG